MTQECEPADRTINYVEFLTGDIDAMKAFYGSAFGWTFTDYGPSYCEFSDGHMKGGFAEGESSPSAAPWSSSTPEIWKPVRIRWKSGRLDHETDLRFSRRPAIPFHGSRRIRTGRLDRSIRRPFSPSGRGWPEGSGEGPCSSSSGAARNQSRMKSTSRRTRRGRRLSRI